MTPAAARRAGRLPGAPKSALAPRLDVLAARARVDVRAWDPERVQAGPGAERSPGCREKGGNADFGSGRVAGRGAVGVLGGTALRGPLAPPRRGPGDIWWALEPSPLRRHRGGLPLCFIEEKQDFFREETPGPAHARVLAAQQTMGRFSCRRGRRSRPRGRTLGVSRAPRNVHVHGGLRAAARAPLGTPSLASPWRAGPRGSTRVPSSETSPTCRRKGVQAPAPPSQTDGRFRGGSGSRQLASARPGAAQSGVPGLGDAQDARAVLGASGRGHRAQRRPAARPPAQRLQGRCPPPKTLHPRPRRRCRDRATVSPPSCGCCPHPHRHGASECQTPGVWGEGKEDSTGGTATAQRAGPGGQRRWPAPAGPSELGRPQERLEAPRGGGSPKQPPRTGIEGHHGALYPHPHTAPPKFTVRLLHPASHAGATLQGSPIPRGPWGGGLLGERGGGEARRLCRGPCGGSGVRAG